MHQAPSFALRIFFAALLAVMFGTGCSTYSARPYAGGQPRFDLVDWFSGRTRSWGVVENRSGKVSRHFTAELSGRREGSTLHLDQRFRYSDGKTERRTWRIDRLDDHRYTATATGFIGPVEAEAYGNAVHLRYTMGVPVGKGTVGLRFDQLMLRQNRDIVYNRANFGKFGVRLGSVSEFFQKVN